MKLNLILKEINYKSLLMAFSQKTQPFVQLLKIGNLNSAAVTLINASESTIVKKLNGICTDNGLSVRIDSIKAQCIDSDTIRLIATLGDVSLISIVNLLLPSLWQTMSQDNKLSFLPPIVHNHSNALTRCVSSFLSCLSNEEKETIIKGVFNGYKKEIIDAIQSAAGNKGLILTIADCTIE